MALTPRQLRTETLLLRRRQFHSAAEMLMISMYGARVDFDVCQRQMRDWSRM